MHFFAPRLSSKPGESELRIADCVDGSDLTAISAYSKNRIGQADTPRHFAIRLSQIESRAWIKSRTDAVIAIGVSSTPHTQERHFIGGSQYVLVARRRGSHEQLTAGIEARRSGTA